LRLQSKIVAIFAVCLLAACARSAPPLPSSGGLSAADLSADEQAMSCEVANSRLDENKLAAQRLEQEIESNRQGNQTAAYLAGAVFPPLALATESNSAEKDTLDQLQSERDRLYVVKRVKRC
jgi:hypothetical protein